MKKVIEMPTSGQFAAVWKFEDKLWCGTFKHEEDVIVRYDQDTDDFEDTEICLGFQNPETTEVIYYVDA